MRRFVDAFVLGSDPAKSEDDGLFPRASSGQHDQTETLPASHGKLIPVGTEQLAAVPVYAQINVCTNQGTTNGDHQRPERNRGAFLLRWPAHLCMQREFCGGIVKARVLIVTRNSKRPP